MPDNLLRSIKARIPLEAKFRMRFHLHNLLARVPGSERVGLSVRKRERHWVVEERGRAASRSICVTSFGRWMRFERGIQNQLQLLASQYGVGQHFQLEPGDVVIDIGANVGEFSLFAAGNGARVIAVEGDPDVAELFRRNTSGVTGIELVAQPIWSEDGPIDFYSSAADAESSLVPPEHWDRMVQVEAVRLDTVTAGHRVNRVKLLKCDAEGAEPEVLSGAVATLAFTQWAAFDCGPERQGERTLDQCRSLLEQAGFDIVSLPSRRGAREIVIARNTRLT